MFENFKSIAEIEEYQKKKDFLCGEQKQLKQNLTIISNCHGSIVREILLLHPDIRKKYNVYIILPYIFVKPDYNVDIDISEIHEIVNNSDIIIAQHMYETTHYSTYFSEGLFKKLPWHVQIIYMTNVQNSALWSKYKPPELELYEWYDSEYKQTMEIFKYKDEMSDTPMYDYVVKNIHSTKLFIDRPHPTFIVFYEITKMILKHMELKPYYIDRKELERNINPCQLPGGFEHTQSDIEHFKLDFARK